jgi:hypothetical protein
MFPYLLRFQKKHFFKIFLIFFFVKKEIVIRLLLELSPLCFLFVILSETVYFIYCNVLFIIKLMK